MFGLPTPTEKELVAMVRKIKKPQSSPYEWGVATLAETRQSAELTFAEVGEVPSLFMILGERDRETGERRRGLDIVYPEGEGIPPEDIVPVVAELLEGVDAGGYVALSMTYVAHTEGGFEQAKAEVESAPVGEREIAVLLILSHCGGPDLAYAARPTGPRTLGEWVEIDAGEHHDNPLIRIGRTARKTYS